VCDSFFLIGGFLGCRGEGGGERERGGEVASEVSVLKCWNCGYSCMARRQGLVMGIVRHRGKECGYGERQ